MEPAFEQHAPQKEQQVQQAPAFEQRQQTRVPEYEPRKEERVEAQRDLGVSSSRLDVDNDDMLPPFLRKHR